MSISRMKQRHAIGARNFLHEEAQARLFEVTAAVAQDLKNAIHVHGTPIWYFRKDYHGTATCTCRKHTQAEAPTDPRPMFGSVAIQPKQTLDHAAVPPTTPQIVTVDFDQPTHEIVEVDFNTPLMWAHNESLNTEPGSEQRPDAAASVIFPTGDDLPELLPETTDATGSVGVNRSFGQGADCAVCCRSGIVNGYTLLGHDRKVLEAASISDISGYSVNRNAAPYLYEKQLDDEDNPYVEFEYFVPAMFNRVYHGVYANAEQQRTYHMTINGDPFSLAALRQHAGQKVALRVSRVARFSHVVLIMELVREQLRADFPQESKPKNYGVFNTLTNQSIHVTNQIPKPNEGDLVLKLTNGQLWKTSDVDTLSTADGTAIGWSLNAAVVQPNQATTLAMAQLFSL